MDERREGGKGRREGRRGEGIGVEEKGGKKGGRKEGERKGGREGGREGLVTSG